MYRGFSVKAAEYLTKYYRVHDVNVLPWQIYTDKDNQMQAAKSDEQNATGKNKFHCPYFPIIIPSISCANQILFLT